MTRKRYHVSDAAKKRMSEGQKRRFAKEKAWNLGVPWPVSTKLRVKESMLKYWRELEEEEREKRFETLLRTHSFTYGNTWGSLRKRKQQQQQQQQSLEKC